MSKPKVTTEGGRKAILVLGAPRSGTSALSHLLSEMGVYFGEESDFLDPAVHTHNPAFFELARLNALNERVLAELGYEYGSFDYFPGGAEPEPSYGTELIEQAKALILQELGGRALVGLKDPRFCFTLPFWRRTLADLGYEVRPVLAMRAQQEIVRSNKKVNANADPYNRRLAWLSVSAAAASIVGWPSMEIDYGDLIESPSNVATRLANWLELPPAVVGPAANVVRKEFRHEVASSPCNLPELAEVAEDYHQLRGRLESLGILELINERRQQVADRDRVIVQQATSISQLTAASEPLVVLRDQMVSNRGLLEHVQGSIEWQSRALQGLGDFLRERASSDSEAQDGVRATIEQQSHAVEGLGEFLRERARSDSEAQDGLRATIERQSHAVEGLGEFLRETAGRDAEACSALASKLEWQSSAIIGLGDFMREYAQAESVAREQLVAKVQWQSDALAGFGVHLQLLVESNRLAQEQLHGEIARLNALIDGNAREMEAQATQLREQVRVLEQQLVSRSAELGEAVAQRESLARQHAAALKALQSRSTAQERLLSELHREADRRAGEIDRLRGELSQSTGARLNAERRAAGFLERIEDLTLQLEDARRPREIEQKDTRTGLFGRWKNKSAGNDNP